MGRVKQVLGAIVDRQKEELQHVLVPHLLVRGMDIVSALRHSNVCALQATLEEIVRNERARKPTHGSMPPSQKTMLTTKLSARIWASVI